MISSNENQNTLKLDNWRKRSPDRGARGLPDEPLTEREIEYLSKVIYDKSFKAYKGRIVSSDLLSDFEEEGDTVGESYIFMRNILSKFDKAVYKGKITPFVILRKVEIEEAIKEFTKNKRKAPKKVLKEIDKSLEDIKVASSKPEQLLKYIQKNREDIINTFSVVKNDKRSFPKNESAFFNAFWSELEKPIKSWDTEKLMVLLKKKRVTVKESFDRVNRDIKDRYRKENDLNDKAAVGTEKYPKEDYDRYEFALEFKKTVKNLSLDEFDMTEQRKIYCHKNRYILPPSYTKKLNKLYQTNEKYQTIVHDYEATEIRALNQMLSKLTFKSLDVLFQQVNIGYFNKDVLIGKNLPKDFLDKIIKVMTKELQDKLNEEESGKKLKAAERKAILKKIKSKESEHLELFESIKDGRILEKITDYVDSQYKKRINAVEQLYNHFIDGIISGKASFQEDSVFTKTEIKKFYRFIEEIQDLKKNTDLDNTSKNREIKNTLQDLYEVLDQKYISLTEEIDLKELEDEIKGFIKNFNFDEDDQSINEALNNLSVQILRAKLFLQKPEIFDKSIDEIFEMKDVTLTEEGFTVDGERLLSYDDQGSNQAKSLEWFTIVYIQNRVNFVACETRSHKELVGSGPSESIIDVPFNPSTRGNGSMSDEDYAITGHLNYEVSKKDALFQRFYYQKYILQVSEKELREEYPDHYSTLKGEIKKLFLLMDKKYKNDWSNQTNHIQRADSPKGRKKKAPFMKAYKSNNNTAGAKKGKSSHLVPRKDIEIPPDFTIIVLAEKGLVTQTDENGKKYKVEQVLPGRFKFQIQHPNTRQVLFEKKKVIAKDFDEAQEMARQYKKEMCPTIKVAVYRTEVSQQFEIHILNEATQEIMFKKTIKARNLLEASDKGEELKQKKFKNLITYWQKEKFIPNDKKRKMKTSTKTDSFEFNE